MSEYKFKRVDDNSYADLEYLHKAAFKENPKSYYYQSKMNTKYLGVSHLGYLAYTEDNKPAASYSVYPYMMQYRGKLYLAAESGDTMTHPDHTGKGLFTTLAKMTYETSKQEGIQFIFGFPNSNSYPGFIKRLNWTHKENMSNYSFKVLTLPFAAIAKKFPFLRAFYKSYARLILKFYTADKLIFPSSAVNETFGGVYRDKNFFSYKNFYDNYLIELGDRLAWIKIDGSLLIGDIEVKEENDINKIVASIKRMAFYLGCSKIIFPVGKETFWDQQFKGKYPCEEGIFVGYLDLQSGLPLENFKYVMADMDTF